MTLTRSPFFLDPWINELDLCVHLGSLTFALIEKTASPPGWSYLWSRILGLLGSVFFELLPSLELSDFGSFWV